MSRLVRSGARRVTHSPPANRLLQQQTQQHNNNTKTNITNPKCLVPAVMEVRVIPRKEFSLPCPPTTNAVRLLPKEAGELLSNQGGFETKGLMTNLCHVALSMTTTSTKTVERRRTMSTLELETTMTMELGTTTTTMKNAIS